MAEAVLAPVPSDTTIVEDVASVFDDVRLFLRSHRETVVVLSAIGISVLVTRSIFRREIRRIRFTVDVMPLDDVGGALADSFHAMDR